MQPFHLFTLADVPVRVSLGYLLLAAYFGYIMRGLGGAFVLVAIFCVTLSLLIHEFGHAMMAKRFKLNPHIMLHGWGGLCFHDRAARNRDDALIIAAGPGIQLVFAGVVAAIRAALPAEAFADRQLFAWTLDLLVNVNFYWALLNLIPLWPLDGGQLFRLGLLRYMKPKRAEDITHYVGAAIGVLGLVYALAVLKAPFLAIIAGLLAFQNVQGINRHKASGPIRKRNTRADEMLTAATRALNAGDFHEAARLCYVARDEQGLSGPQLDTIWSILTIASSAMGDHEDAVDYAIRAPRIAPVFAARLHSLVALGRANEARRELNAPDAPPLTPEVKAKLEALVAG